MPLNDVQARAAVLRDSVAAADANVAATSAALSGAKTAAASSAAASGASSPAASASIADLQAQHAAALSAQAAATSNLHDFLGTQLLAGSVAGAAGGPGGAAGGPVAPLHPVGPGGPVGPVGPIHPGGPVGPVVGPSLPGPEQLLGQLDTGVPVTLLPIRLETRFAPPGSDELRIRIFPDDIHVDTHEPELTADEVAAGQRYWISTWRGGTASDAAERAAWAELANRAGVTRAAWIVRSLEPPAEGRPIDPVPDGSPLPVEPVFPTPPLRGQAWSRAARTTVLPDHWVGLAYSGGSRIAEAWSTSVIPDRLPLGPDPSAAPATNGTTTSAATSTTSATTSGQPPVDPGLAWLVDFSAAEAAGMALRLPLPHGTTAIDRLVVLGVRTSMDAAASSQRLAGLLDAQHFTAGLSFLPPGTPTNNTPTDRSGWSSRPSADAAFPVERGVVVTDPDSNASVTAAALGVDAAEFQHVAHAGDVDQRHARSMNTVLWAPTWGYYLDQMMDPAFDQHADLVDSARNHFLGRVRGIGPLPALRVGNQPYGLLPATSIARWQPAGESADVARFDGLLATLIGQLEPYWQRGVDAVPRVGPGMPDPDRQILQALGMSAVSSSIRARSVRGATYCMAQNGFLAIDTGDTSSAQSQAHLSTIVLLALQWPFRPYLADCRYEADASPLYLPVVSGQKDAAARTAEAATYLAHLHDAPIHDIQVEAGSSAGPATLLNILARHATLQEFGVQAITLQPLGTSVAKAALLEPELVGIAAQAAVGPGSQPAAGGGATVLRAAATQFEAARIATPDQSTPSQLLGQPIAGVTGTLSAGAYISQQVAGGAALPFHRLAGFLAALQDLAGVDAGMLELLFTSTLDTASHRLDAWSTSLATDRLATLRARRPTGTYLGAYGWVENLVAKPPLQPLAENPTGETGTLLHDPTNAGFVHAPSIPQATTAAVMRSANLTHAARGSTNALAVDLSSARVRAATRLLDGVREGQPLGALLGYQLERALHEGHPGIELDECIAPLRALAPLVTGKLTPVADGEADESIGARNVVDGLALSRMPRASVQAALQTALPDAGTKWPVVAEELDALDDAVDALSDLLLSEGVHHLVSGNPERAGATIDAIGRGDAVPPEPEVVRTPRSGTAITERLLLLADLAPAAAPGWPAPSTPRPTAEPRLDAWCGRMLGPAASYRLRALFGAPGGSTSGSPGASPDAPPASPVEVSFATLGLSPLDVVMECDRPGASSLERRLGRMLAASPPAGAPAGVTAATPVTLVAERDAAWTSDVKGLVELLEVGRTLRELLAAARPIKASDVALPGPTPPTGWDVSELQPRAGAAVAALASALGALQPLLADGATPTDGQLQAAAWRLADFGMAGPDATLAGQALATVALSLAKEGQARTKKVADIQAAGRPAVDDGSFDLSLLEAVFGPDLRVLPVCKPANAAALQASFGADLVAGDPTAPRTWLRRSAPVRPGAGRLETALLYASALGTGEGLGLRVGQVPYVAPAAGDPAPRWVGLPFDGAPPNGPTTGLVVHGPDGLDVTNGSAGLVVDDWVEVIPAARATTGLSFHFDAPGSRAPQTVLLAVSPDPSRPWDLPTFEAVLNETIDLAKMRMVDLDALPWAGRFLPATFVADNALDTTTGIHIRDLLKIGATLHAQALSDEISGGG